MFYVLKFRDDIQEWHVIGAFSHENEAKDMATSHCGHVSKRSFDELLDFAVSQRIGKVGRALNSLAREVTDLVSGVQRLAANVDVIKGHKAP